MNEESDDSSSYEYYSDYEEEEEQFNYSHNLSPYSKTPLPDFTERELEASRALRKWLKMIRELSGEDVDAFLERKQIIENENSPAIRECSNVALETKTVYEIAGDSGDSVEGKKQGKLDVEREIHYKNGDYFCGEVEEGCPEGEGSLVLKTGEKFSGRWRAGRLEGVVREELDRGNLVRRVQYRGGVRQGTFIEHSPAGKHFKSIGSFHCGQKTGVCWTATRGGGFLVGEVTSPHTESESVHHGTDQLFLYPDLVTAIQGQFAHGRLVSGRLGHVRNFRLTGVVPELEVDVSVGAGGLYHYQPAGSLCISRSPLLRDPFECRYVFVSQSRAGAGAGEGLFAKTDLARGQLCALFNGVRQRRLTGQYFHQPDWSDYRIGCGAETDLDILPGQERLENYRATLAHKVCHSFNNNCSFAQFWHPRFGNIMSVVAATDIKAGEELCVCYNYKLDSAPDWYLQLWAQHTGSGREMH